MPRQSPNRIPKPAFLEVVRSAPIVAIDMIVRNAEGDVLLGLRNNEPAARTWFVPGGRVLKDEPLDAAFERISLAEMGVRLRRSDAGFAGLYEHLYDENFALEPGFGTHYVVLAHEIEVTATISAPADDQHGELRWWSVEDLLSSSAVHDYTKNYFRHERR